MTSALPELGEALRKPRFSFNRALFLFAIPVAVLMLMQSKRRDGEIIKQTVGVKRRLSNPIMVRTPVGQREIVDFDDYYALVLSIPLPDRNDRLRECIGAARKVLLIAWTEIASGQDIAHAMELGRFSAFAALDAVIEVHPQYKKESGFKARLQRFANRAQQDDMLQRLSLTSGYTVEELRTSAIEDLAVTRNVTGHCKAHKSHTRTPSSHIDLRPIHLASAMISVLQP